MSERYELMRVPVELDRAAALRETVRAEVTDPARYERFQSEHSQFEALRPRGPRIAMWLSLAAALVIVIVVGIVWARENRSTTITSPDTTPSPNSTVVIPTTTTDPDAVADATAYYLDMSTRLDSRADELIAHWFDGEPGREWTNNGMLSNSYPEYAADYAALLEEWVRFLTEYGTWPDVVASDVQALIGLHQTALDLFESAAAMPRDGDFSSIDIQVNEVLFDAHGLSHQIRIALATAVQTTASD